MLLPHLAAVVVEEAEISDGSGCGYAGSSA
jgi:hypothetical protein